ncbi:MAG: hypothetical protein Kow0062_03510 [Acidobacteriota bacterium]
MTLARLIVLVFEAYVAAGAILALPLLLRGLGRIDRVAAASGAGFRLMIAPSVVALWPLLLVRWLRAGRTPRQDGGLR